MINIQNKKKNEFVKDGDLPDFEKMSEDYWNKSREMETKTIEDLEKYLWLTNSAAATISIAYLQQKETSTIGWDWVQYCGAWAFVCGILMLLLMKYISMINSSRDRYRFQDALSKFNSGKTSDKIFENVRDNKFKYLKKRYLFLQYGSGIAFVMGCILTLIGVVGVL